LIVLEVADVALRIAGVRVSTNTDDGAGLKVTDHVPSSGKPGIGITTAAIAILSAQITRHVTAARGLTDTASARTEWCAQTAATAVATLADHAVHAAAERRAFWWRSAGAQG
jgi:hypothetical protein